jgi:PAS domain S-box-containing protein
MINDPEPQQKASPAGKFRKSTGTKFLLIVGALIFLFSGIIFYRNWKDSISHTQKLLSAQTELALQFDLAIRKYVAESVRPFAEQHVGEDEFVSETMSTSFVARSIFEKVRKKFPDYVIKFSSDDPRNPANQAGPKEWEIIQYFNENPDLKEWTGQIELEGQFYQARFAARRMKEKCLRCHGDPADAPASLIERYGDTAGFHRPVGEVVALDAIAVPVQKYRSAALTHALTDSGMMVGGLLLLLFVAYGIFRLLVSNLEKEVNQRRQVEKHIVEQNDFLKNIIESLTYPFYVIDAQDYTIMIANSAAGATEGSTCYSTINKSNQPCTGELVCPLAEVKRTKKSVVTEHLHYEKDGNPRNIEVHGYPILDDHGNVVQMIEYLIDVTERKQEKSKYQTLFESSSDAVMLLDEKGFFDCNNATLKIFGCATKEEFCSKHPAELSPPPQPCGTDSMALVNQRIATAMKEGSNFFEWMHQRTNGVEFPAEVLLNALDLNDRQVVQAVVRDISERKEAEERLRRLAMIAEQAYEGIAYADLERIIQFANLSWAKMHGYETADELIGKPLSIFHTEEQLKTDVIPFNEEVKKNGRNMGEVGHVRKDGTKFPAEMTVSLFRNDQAEPIGVIGFANDITLRKQAENKLNQAKDEAERANQAKSEFLANMSHEIRTPMNAILGFSDLLVDEDLTEEQRGYVLAIRESGQNLLSLINDILDFSKIEAGRLDTEIIDCPLGPLLAGVESMMNSEAEKKGLAFEIRFDKNLPARIRSDPARLRQCLINLTNNAIKFTRTGHVLIKASLREINAEPHICFEVEDTGIGIPTDKQEAILKSFTQADGSTTRKFGGTGLGLTITKQLAGLLGGNLTVKSEPGKGSVFSLTIPANIDLKSQPLLVEADLTLKKDNKSDQSATGQFAGRVLIAEDVKTNQLLIKSFLEGIGLEVTFAENGKQAVQKAQAHSFDLIFMDIQMPEMDGYEATRTLRRKSVTTPIIALTAHAMEGDQEKCLNIGMDDYITKPIDKNVLIAVLKRWLRQSGSKSLDTEPVEAKLKEPVITGEISEPEIFNPAQVLHILDGDVKMLHEILQAFFEAMEDDVKELRNHVQAADYESAAREAHKIKGAAANIGAEALRVTALEIEQSAKADDLEKVSTLLENIDQELDVLERTLKDYDWSEPT